MNKTAIKNFAVWARNKLIADISYKAGLLGITQNGIASALPQSTGTTEFYDIGTAEPYSINGDEIRQRNLLVEMIERKAKETDYKTAYNYIIEEVAYTWFNRLIAIRFMEVNDYLPSHIRVLSSEIAGKHEPDIVTTPFETDLEFSEIEKKEIVELKYENNLDELFQKLFIKQCNKLSEILPELFEKIGDYSEILLNIAFTDNEGLVHHLVTDIDEDDFNVEKGGQVEIIGWLYQFYISERHGEIINALHSRYYSKEEIPAATQIFTTDWVVRYLVDNSLGKFWIERSPESPLRNKLEYLIASDDDFSEKFNAIDPQEIKIIDPCVGSGHFLVYAFEVLMHIYRECGWSERDAAISIIKNNIHGLDIDKRASQLAYFSLMMTARKYNRRIFGKPISLKVKNIKQSISISTEVLAFISKNNIEVENLIKSVIDDFNAGDECGSIINIEYKDYSLLKESLNVALEETKDSLITLAYEKDIKDLMGLVEQAELLLQKYHVVVTNPPYMNKFSPKLKKYINENYPISKSDLFSVFIEKSLKFGLDSAYVGLMTPIAWMFNKSYRQLREVIIDNCSVASLIQMAPGAFDEAGIDVCAFVLSRKQSEKGAYIRLDDFKGNMDFQNEKVKEAISNRECGYYYETYAEKFKSIPGCPMAYWISDALLDTFDKGMMLGDVAKPRQGMATSDNNRFLRLWYEIILDDVYFGAETIEEAASSNKKWFPYNKGGSTRKWYGNNDYLINWENDGKEVKAYASDLYKCITRTIQNIPFYFKECFTWSLISTTNISFRYRPAGSIFDKAGMSCFADNNLHLLLAACNSKMTSLYMKIFAPTINCQAGDVAGIPILEIEDQNEKLLIENIVKENIQISKNDWDSFETSWDFKMHPLVAMRISGAYAWGDDAPTMRVSSAYKAWEQIADERFRRLKANEEKLNEVFINMYGLHDELTPYVEDKDVTVYKADVQRDIKGLLSYAVGCMFGRYSLDVEGIAFAGGEWNEAYYNSFIPDKDNCIPITDEEYFEDDIVARFCDWMKVVYGVDTLEDNLDFVAKALGTKGNTSREVIRNYFLNDFIKDHIKMYQKRPIYWLFDSGKKNGFKALVYMHRWNADTIGNLRIDYLHRAQRTFESEINRMQDMIDHSTNNREVAAATKRKEKLQKQLKECREYDEKIGHLALSRIDIDLDDGVKVNYEKVQTASDGKKYQVLVKG